MGFYCIIHSLSCIDKKTGKLYVTDLTVPEEYRRFLDEKGPWFRAYMRDDRWMDDMCDVLQEFPTWEYVKEQFPRETSSEYGWTKKDHDLFYEAVKWFGTQKQSFIVIWG